MFFLFFCYFFTKNTDVFYPDIYFQQHCVDIPLPFSTFCKKHRPVLELLLEIQYNCNEWSSEHLHIMYSIKERIYSYVSD